MLAWKRLKSFVTATVLAVGLGGCAIGAYDGGPSFVERAPAEDQAMIYVYKPISYGKGEFPIIVNDRVVTVLKKGGYFPYEVDPGEHKITLVEWEQIRDPKDVALTAVFHGIVGAAIVAMIPDISHSVTVNAEPGGSYYVRETPGGGVGLELMPSAAAARPGIAETKLLPPYRPKE